MSSLRFAAFALSLPLTFASAASSQTLVAGARSVQRFHLPRQSLSTSLRIIARNSGISVVAPADLVRRRVAPELDGAFSPRQAIDTLLAGSGLSAREVGDGLVIERDTSSDPQASHLNLKFGT